MKIENHFLLLCIICFISLTGISLCWQDNDFHGISQVAFVVANLDEATKWYTDVLGGILVPKLSTDGLYGDSHYYRMFQREILQVANNGGTLDSVGVPDISDNGQWKVQWNMIMFGNFMMQLMQFVDRNNPDVVWDKRHPEGDGAAKVTTQHYSFWNQDSVDLSDYVVKLRELSGPSQSAGKSAYWAPLVFNSVNQVSTRAQQYAEAVEDVVVLGGAVLSAAGPNHERVEWSSTKPSTGERKPQNLEQFCVNKASAPQVINADEWKNGRSVAASLLGLHHAGVIVDNWDDTHKFYNDVMGGKSSHGVFIVPQFNWYQVEFQDDILNAQEEEKDLTSYGIININAEGFAQNISFIAFENAFLELNEFYRTGSSGNYESYPLRWQSLSPAYLRSMTTGFGVKDSLSLDDVIKKVEQKSAELGLTRVKFNRIVQVDSSSQTVPVSDYSEPLGESEGDLEGYNYVFLSGASEENLMFVDYKGKSRDALKEAMEAYDAISSRFESTDIWKRAGFKSDYCCSEFNMCDVGKPSGAARSNALNMLSLFTIACIAKFFYLYK